MQKGGLIFGVVLSLLLTGCSASLPSQVIAPPSAQKAEKQQVAPLAAPVQQKTRPPATASGSAAAQTTALPQQTVGEKALPLRPVWQHSAGESWLVPGSQAFLVRSVAAQGETLALYQANGTLRWQRDVKAVLENNQESVRLLWGAISPDGQAVALLFQDHSGISAAALTGDGSLLWRKTVLAGHVRGYVVGLAISSDGRRVVVAQSPNKPATQVTLTLLEDGQKQWQRHYDHAKLGNLFLSDDGMRVLFDYQDGKGNQRAMLLNATGNTLWEDNGARCWALMDSGNFVVYHPPADNGQPGLIDWHDATGQWLATYSLSDQTVSQVAAAPENGQLAVSTVAINEGTVSSRQVLLFDPFGRLQHAIDPVAPVLSMALLRNVLAIAEGQKTQGWLQFSSPSSSALYRISPLQEIGLLGDGHTLVGRDEEGAIFLYRLD